MMDKDKMCLSCSRLDKISFLSTLLLFALDLVGVNYLIFASQSIFTCFIFVARLTWINEWLNERHFAVCSAVISGQMAGVSLACWLPCTCFTNSRPGLTCRLPPRLPSCCALTALPVCFCSTHLTHLSLHKLSHAARLHGDRLTLHY